MIILINGSFGAGKTTVARLLVERIPQSALFNPELIGFVLQRVPGFVPLSGSGAGDFQDMPLWRRLTTLAALTLHRIAGRTIIIPMAFCKLEYLNQVRSRLTHSGVAVQHFCLTASIEIIHERLRKRGVSPSTAEGQWVYPRAARCCEVHAAPEFGEHIDTNNRSPGEIADDISERVRVA